jgi:hypothetical protein
VPMRGKRNSFHTTRATRGRHLRTTTADEPPSTTLTTQREPLQESYTLFRWQAGEEWSPWEANGFQRDGCVGCEDGCERRRTWMTHTNLHERRATMMGGGENNNGGIKATTAAGERTIAAIVTTTREEPWHEPRPHLARSIWHDATMTTFGKIHLARRNHDHIWQDPSDTTQS